MLLFILKVNRLVFLINRHLAAPSDGIALSSVRGTIFLQHVDQFCFSNHQLIIMFSVGVHIPSMLNLPYEVSNTRQSTMFRINP